MKKNQLQPEFQQIQQAYERIKGIIHRTPVLTCTSINQMVQANLFFKCENFQKTGSFKFRGASNTVFSLSEKEASRGVVTHSSGNHAAALSLSAKMKGIPAYIVMPSSAPNIKVEAVKGYRGIITFCEPTLKSREETAQKIIDQKHAHLVHPYNNYKIIAGQGTAALELMEEVDDLDIILAPVGGGGLLSGTAVTAKSNNKSIKVIGCEPENADDAYRSKKAGYIIPSENPDTIADGLLTSLGTKTFPVIRDLVDDIVLVSEHEIVKAMHLLYERMKIVIEPSSAVVLGALIAEKVKIRNKKVGLVVSGGNIDISGISSVINLK
ncbi:MAG: pyridoxal-phosphate dependent enzyme [bacterium]